MRLHCLRLASALVLGCVFSGIVGADDTINTDKLGTKIGSFTCKDAAGKSFALADLKDRKAVVVVFLNFECPVSTSYSQTLAELAKTYADRGVTFIGIVAGDEDEAALAKQLNEFKFPFGVYRDEKFSAADALKAGITPEAFVLDHNFYLRYRGRIDNGYAARLKRNVHITEHDLRQALDDLLAGKPVSKPATQAIGCAIQRERVARKDGAVTYHRDVLPILAEYCQSCHRPNAVAPFSLMTYRQAVNWAADIKEYTQNRKMPPWKPTDGQQFHNERKLTDKQLALLARWVDNDTPEGDPKDAPPPRRFTDGWQLGEPDLVLTMSDDYQVGPSGRDVFRCMVLPTNLQEDKVVTAIEVRPGNARILHHTLCFIDTKGRGRALEAKEKEKVVKEDDLDRGPGYSAGMGGVGFTPDGSLRGWAPGQLPRFTPEGTGFLLPKGSDVVLQMHYHRNGRLEKDRTSIGLYFAKKPIQKRFQGMIIAGGPLILGRPVPTLLRIPANNEDYKVTGSIWVTTDCDLHEIMPHMHMVGKKVKVTMTPPDGETQTLIAIDDWDYNWQETYVFEKTIKVKAGTRFDVEARYDNSVKNPNNPSNPPRVVKFGEQTTDEMCFIFMGATPDKPGGRVRQAFEDPNKKKEEKKPGEEKKP